MSEEKDGLKSIKVYKFNNMKESWHKFALKFRVIADDRGYDNIIEGIVAPPDEKYDLEILDKDNAAVKKSKRKIIWPELRAKKGLETLLCQQKVSRSTLLKILVQTS